MKNYFIGIDLGGKNKKTTGVFVLKENLNGNLEIVYREKILGSEILNTIGRFLEKTAVIAIDAPLTVGRGKGKMRLFEKFLSQKTFKKEQINPIPPALMPKICNFSVELKKNLEKLGFVLDINLIEAFPTFLKKIVNLKKFFEKIKEKKILFSNKDEEMAFYCAVLGYWHWKLKSRYLGYKDGFLFLPEFYFWKKEWKVKFFKTWKKRDKLKYRYLLTNLFED